MFKKHQMSDGKLVKKKGEGDEIFTRVLFPLCHKAF
jgi:hypothetical protein